MNNLFPRFALAASVLLSACGTAPMASAPAPVYTPTPIVTAPSPTRRPTPMICEDRRGNQIRCAP